MGACFSILLFIGCAGPLEDLGSADDTNVEPSSTTDGTSPEVAAAPAPTIKILRGVDRASVFSTAEAKLLHDSHDVRWTGVYIGGACNGGSGWTKSAIEAISHATGWRFMPIWVGQQSPAICGAHSLTYATGHADGVAAAARMRALGWGGNRAIPVALDVEAGTYDYSAAASTRYVHGWITAVHAAGFRAYVYGSPSGLDHFHDAKLRIDAAWVASYFYNGFENVAPDHLDQLGNRYKHKNRAWQYASFDLKGVGGIDADTSQLMLAPAPGGTNRGTAARALPASCGTLAIGEGLEAGEAIASCDGGTVLALSTSGALSLTTNGASVWSTDTAGAIALLDETGELVVLDTAGATLFTTNTGGFPDANVAISAAGLSVIDDDGSALWTNHSGLLVRGDAENDLSDAPIAP